MVIGAAGVGCWAGGSVLTLLQVASALTLCQSVNVQLTQQPTVNTFAAALRRFREAAGLSQRGLAKRCGLTAAYLSLLEAGRRAPERGAVERIAGALEVAEREQAELLLAAGYAAAIEAEPARPSPLAEVEALLQDEAFTTQQRTLMTTLVTAYAEGLITRARTGRPLVSDLAAPWQQQILETLQEKMAEDFESFREGFMRPSFDL
jgi:transcriptional regulator with XRE-family HTH domain